MGYAFLLVLAGILQGAMISLNGRLSAYYNPMTVVFFAHGIPTLLLLAYLVFVRRIRLFGKASVPSYVFLVGFLGTSMVGISSFVTARVGAVAFGCIANLSNIAASAVIDHFGLFGADRRPFRLKQVPYYLIAIVGVLLIVTG